MSICELTIVFEDDNGERFGPPPVMIVGNDNAESLAVWVAEYVFESDTTVVCVEIAIAPKVEESERWQRGCIMKRIDTLS